MLSILKWNKSRWYWSESFRHHCSQVTTKKKKQTIIRLELKIGSNKNATIHKQSCKCKIQSDSYRAAMHCKRTSHYVKMTDYLEESIWQLTYNVNTIYYKIGWCGVRCGILYYIISAVFVFSFIFGHLAIYHFHM